MLSLKQDFFSPRIFFIFRWENLSRLKAKKKIKRKNIWSKRKEEFSWWKTRFKCDEFVWCAQVASREEVGTRSGAGWRTGSWRAAWAASSPCGAPPCRWARAPRSRPARGCAWPPWPRPPWPRARRRRRPCSGRAPRSAWGWRCRARRTASGPTTAPTRPSSSTRPPSTTRTPARCSSTGCPRATASTCSAATPRTRTGAAGGPPAPSRAASTHTPSASASSRAGDPSIRDSSSPPAPAGSKSCWGLDSNSPDRCQASTPREQKRRFKSHGFPDRQKRKNMNVYPTQHHLAAAALNSRPSPCREAISSCRCREMAPKSWFGIPQISHTLSNSSEFAS